MIYSIGLAMSIVGSVLFYITVSQEEDNGNSLFFGIFYAIILVIGLIIIVSSLFLQKGL